MTFGHAAALALVGWYLMVPPERHGWFSAKEYYVYSAPVAEWRVVKSFDVAALCEQMRDQFTDGSDSSHNTQIKTLTEVMRRSQCISTDDPRLKGN